MSKSIKAPEPISTKKILNLNILQRLKISGMLDASPTRSLGESRLNNKIVEKVSMSDADLEASGVVRTDGGDGKSWFRFSKGFSTVEEIEFTNEEYARLCSFFREGAGPAPEELRTWLEDVLGQLGI